MPEFLLAVVSPRTFAELFEPVSAWNFEIRHAPTPGDALRILQSESDCRLVVLGRDVEPQLAAFVQRLRRDSPGLEVVLLGPEVSDRVRDELEAQHVELLDLATPKNELVAALRHRFQRASLQARAGLIGASPALHACLETVLQVGPTDLPVLITGPSGAGKELVARAVFLASRRADAPFVALNVGALAESVLESELFGHERGAFTGAVARKAGVFERADGGTLFLDEVGEMTPHMQVRLLRVLDSGEVTPVGGTRPMRVDVRLVAATNRALEDAVRHGEFREDLYYRLKVVQLELPPLAARREDIPVLVQHFLKESATLHGTQPRRTTEAALRLLASSDWPGNVRELRNVVYGMAVLAKKPLLDVEDIPPALRGGANPNLPMPVRRSLEQAERDVILSSLLALRHDLQEVLAILRSGVPAAPRAVVVEPVHTVTPIEPHTLRDGEREMIEEALAAAGGNRRLAAQRLGIAERTLYRKLKAYGL